MTPFLCFTGPCTLSRPQVSGRERNANAESCCQPLGTPPPWITPAGRPSTETPPINTQSAKLCFGARVAGIRLQHCYRSPNGRPAQHQKAAARVLYSCRPGIWRLLDAWIVFLGCLVAGSFNESRSNKKCPWDRRQPRIEHPSALLNVASLDFPKKSHVQRMLHTCCGRVCTWLYTQGPNVYAPSRRASQGHLSGNLSGASADHPEQIK